ncbi:MAG: flagellar basal body-associated FliL family protein [Gammaproteobacteria bacterium]|nr:flagellar basal body-associated FliL family protein [Gammaproteobacteria bacterium]
MANDKPKVDARADAQAAAPGKRSRRLPLIIAAVVLIGGGVGAWLAFKSRPAAEQAAAGAAALAQKAAPIYFKFDPAFVVNFGQDGSTRYLQLTLEAMSRDATVIEDIKSNEPAIRNDLVLLYSAQQYDTLASAAGKEQLRADTLAAIRRILAGEGARAEAVEGVYFTSFVIQ